MASDLFTVQGICRLARDPELRSLPSGMSVCELRVAWNNSRKNNQTGEWDDVGNFINVTVWGNQGEALARNLTKGQRIGIVGRLEHRTWEDQGGNKREAHQIVAERVQYLSPKDDTGGGGFTPRQDVPVAQPAAQRDDDDIPF
jgi:single-strand DNA-binding protein